MARFACGIERIDVKEPSTRELRMRKSTRNHTDAGPACLMREIEIELLQFSCSPESISTGESIEITLIIPINGSRNLRVDRDGR